MTSKPGKVNEPPSDINKEKCICSQCGKKYSRKDYLKSHIDGAHNNVKQACCTICKKQFTQTNLRIHIKISTCSTK